jgi:hypothetical protein
MREHANMHKSEMAEFAEDVLQQVPEDHRRRGLAAGVGATIGGVVGSVLAGPIGAAVGASLGGGVGVAVAEKSGEGGAR